MKETYLIHGTSTRDDDWFPWLEEAAKPEIKVNRLAMPEAFAPHLADWQQFLDQQLPTDPGLTLVAHSLGCISAIKFVQRHPELENVNLVLVAPFDRPLPNSPMLDEFVKEPVGYHQVAPRLHKAVVITAKNDWIAPFENAEQIAQRLGAKLIVNKMGGHYLAGDGFTEFPQVLDELKWTLAD
ncbi:MAG TPA: alpha/beta hydrolase [Candidatus Limosilactobacillus merdipullorum]|uniref:Alpha/beta hydrolase n=1 Tax=Candidatus Limosilactobacillus merdipullorum TaxID=2838653 RepID=A0A9D1U4L7_9LACO|nr:alpha/beta hydrolase [Candidatus Limosilactobacillus merdipullorum]